MRKRLHLIILLLVAVACQAMGQTAHFEVKSTHFTLKKDSLSATDSLLFSYEAYYHGGTGSDSVFSGYINTYISTGKNAAPLKSKDSTIVNAGHPLKNGDSIGCYGIFLLNSHYFDNSDNNIIVIWPTGARSSTGSVVTSVDSIHSQKIKVKGLTGIAGALNLFNPVKIYPNPANTTLHLYYNGTGPMPDRVRILDISGKEMMTINKNIRTIDISQLKPGTYFIEINCPDHQQATYSFLIR